MRRALSGRCDPTTTNGSRVNSRKERFELFDIENLSLARVRALSPHHNSVK